MVIQTVINPPNNKKTKTWLLHFYYNKCLIFILKYVFSTTILPWYSWKYPAVPHKYTCTWILAAFHISKYIYIYFFLKCLTVWVYVLLVTLKYASSITLLSLSCTRSCSLFLHVSCICALLSSTHTSSFLHW